MSRFTARVEVTLKAGVNDPQGNAVLGGLRSLGFSGAQAARVGKLITLDLEAPDAESARRQVDEMCAKLLANPVIESYEARIADAP